MNWEDSHLSLFSPSILIYLMKATTGIFLMLYIPIRYFWLYGSECANSAMAQKIFCKQLWVIQLSAKCFTTVGGLRHSSPRNSFSSTKVTGSCPLVRTFRPFQGSKQRYGKNRRASCTTEPPRAPRSWSSAVVVIPKIFGKLLSPRPIGGSKHATICLPHRKNDLFWLQIPILVGSWWDPHNVLYSRNIYIYIHI